jgi:hypothetical protein
MTKRLTLQQIAASSAIEDLVGRRPDPRWGRACLHTKRYDGLSIADWFRRYSAAERVELVRSALLEQKPWSPLLRVNIPKAHTPGVTRAVDMQVVVDHARVQLLRAMATPVIEPMLTRVAVAYRPGLQLAQTLKNAHVRMASRPIAAVLDIRSFFESVPWSGLDNVLDRLAVDEGTKALLMSLVRVEVVERRSMRLVERNLGLPQGLSISPLLANLVLARFDKETAHALSAMGGWLRRYCDDMLVLLPDTGSAEEAVHVVGERLRRLGFAVKPGTGVVTDTRVEPISWLGISFGPAGLQVPQKTVAAKVTELQAKLTHGVLSKLGLEDALSGLEHHYGRILAPGHSQELVRSIRERLDLSGVHPIGKVGIERLRSLVSDPRAEPSAEFALWGQPSQVEGQAGARDPRVAPMGASGRIL